MVKTISRPNQSKASDSTPEVLSSTVDTASEIKPIDPLIPVVNVVGRESHNTETKFIRRRLAVIAAGALAVVGVGSLFFGKDNGNAPVKPDKAVELEFTTPVNGTLEAIPKNNQGYIELLQEEGRVSGVEVSDAEAARMLPFVESLNPGDYGNPRQPGVGEPIIIPNIVGDVSVDSTPTTQAAPTITTAP